MTSPRFDNDIAYRIATSLSLEIQSTFGTLTPSFIRYMLRYPFTWRTGRQVKRMLNTLHKLDTERATILADQLYLSVTEVDDEPDEDCLQ